MKILVVAAHPDDEILGCGGTIARHIQQGDQVSIVILAEGVTSRAKQRSVELDSEKLQELANASLLAGFALGVKDISLHDFPDNRMDTIAMLDVVKLIEVHIERLHPDLVYTHHAGDVNLDHRVIYQAVITACRPQPGHSVKTILCFETVSSTEWQPALGRMEFSPNWFVDISNTLPIKMQALSHYESELRPWPHPRSLQTIEYLARWRGTMIGVEAAEAFELARHIL